MLAFLAYLPDASISAIVAGGFLENSKNLIIQAYAAFNNRDIDGALSLMSESVSWPKASEGGRVTGKEAVRAYWTRQWKEFDPHVEPMEISERSASKAEVKLRQLVKNLAGDVLSDSVVWHVHTIINGVIERMDLKEIPEDADVAPSAAFVDSKLL